MRKDQIYVITTGKIKSSRNEMVRNVITFNIKNGTMSKHNETLNTLESVFGCLAGDYLHIVSTDRYGHDYKYHIWNVKTNTIKL